MIFIKKYKTFENTSNLLSNLKDLGLPINQDFDWGWGHLEFEGDDIKIFYGYEGWDITSSDTETIESVKDLIKDRNTFEKEWAPKLKKLKDLSISVINKTFNIKNGQDILIDYIEKGFCKSVGGYLYLGGTPIQSLGNLESVGGYLYLSNKYIDVSKVKIKGSI